MRALRIIAGALVLLLLAGGVAGGVWVLYEHAGGGLPIEVEFADAKGLSGGDSVVYGDRIVGRVESVTRGAEASLVRARIAAEHAEIVRERCRFWIDSRLGAAILNFDRVHNAGPIAQPGQRFEGYTSRPEPDRELRPTPSPRPLRARPAWLCAVRATITTDAGNEQTLERSRKGAGAIISANEYGDLLILCPYWIVEPAGPPIAKTLRVDLLGEGPRIAQLIEIRGEHAVLYVPQTAYRERAAGLWPHELADGQGLVLADAGGTAYTAEFFDGGLDFRAGLQESNIVLIDGLNLAGFALPEVGAATGARWVSLHGALDAIAAALEKIEE